MPTAPPFDLTIPDTYREIAPLDSESNVVADASARVTGQDRFRILILLRSGTVVGGDVTIMRHQRIALADCLWLARGGSIPPAMLAWLQGGPLPNPEYEATR